MASHAPRPALTDKLCPKTFWFILVVPVKQYIQQLQARPSNFYATIIRKVACRYGFFHYDRNIFRNEKNWKTGDTTSSTLPRKVWISNTIVTIFLHSSRRALIFDSKSSNLSIFHKIHGKKKLLEKLREIGLRKLRRCFRCYQTFTLLGPAQTTLKSSEKISETKYEQQNERTMEPHWSDTRKEHGRSRYLLIFTFFFNAKALLLSEKLAGYGITRARITNR